MTPITSFDGEYDFLSNFYPIMVMFDKEPYRTVEHAYQAAKTLNLEHRHVIQSFLFPGVAKRAGRDLTLRPGWEEMKLDVMLGLLRQKFEYPDLKRRLLETGSSTLVEGNTWNDTYWGVCRGVGENHLGKLLMRVREENR